jgi:hypothetical protein
MDDPAASGKIAAGSAKQSAISMINTPPTIQFQMATGPASFAAPRISRHPVWVVARAELRANACRVRLLATPEKFSHQGKSSGTATPVAA